MSWDEMLFTSKDFHIFNNFMFWAGNGELYSLMNFTQTVQRLHLQASWSM